MQFFAFTILPFFAPANVTVAIVLFGIAYGILAVKLQRTLTDPLKMMEIRTKMNKITAEMKSLTGKNDELLAKQNEMMPLLSQSMKMQMKPIFVILPVFYLVYYYALPTVLAQYNGAISTIIVPLTSSSLFFLTVLIFSMATSMILMHFDKKRVMAVQAASINADQST